MNSYKTAAGDFVRKMVFRARDVLLPAEWLSTYGGGCPNLMHLARSVIGYKQNQISVETNNTKNFQECQRLDYIVYVRYNLRLKQMVVRAIEHDSSDPVLFDCSNIFKGWVKEKDLSSEDCADSNWMTLDPTSANRGPLGPFRDKPEEFYAGPTMSLRCDGYWDGIYPWLDLQPQLTALQIVRRGYMMPLRFDGCLGELFLRLVEWYHVCRVWLLKNSSIPFCDPPNLQFHFAVSFNESVLGFDLYWPASLDEGKK